MLNSPIVSYRISLSVLVFFGALLRRYYLRDISASSAIEMYDDIALYKFSISIYLSIYPHKPFPIGGPLEPSLYI